METILIISALLGLLLLRVPVAFAMGALGVVLLWLKGFSLIAVPQRLFGSMDSFELLAVPLFLLMSNVLLKGGVGRDLFASVQAWVGHWPGGLGVTTIKSCTLFSAISGSSVATAATIGTVAIPEMEKRGYDRPFIMGQLAAGGTLGILIPPSIPLIIYGVITETSIPTLFLAGIGPGLFLATLFVIYAVLYSRGKDSLKVDRLPMRARLRLTLYALPTVLLAVAIIGSIYAGIATPSESAGVGFVMAMLMTIVMGRMTFAKLREAVHDSLITTAMIFIIVAGAKVFSYAITLYLIPQSISSFLTENITSPTIFIFAVGLVLLIIGFFLEALSMMLIMVPVLYPALEVMGIDPIWFGIFFVVLIETALITPPVGLNLFVIQAVGKAKLEEVVQGAIPFALIMLSTAILLWFWQDLALYVPYRLF
ncbi:Sialic acid TRAP transporter permease protein SiaT [Falsiruegeria litorea R37]|uniref:TRAP transporter large permease protein n=1 Tax=Falsiruegeria litorea R37 TaxID=1200284 RepID=A0A1Y5RPQ6_9RHOB|nr:TRAP transporter large permease subunit [Falsiruegeria litorea]SLN22477.1 Sialic acid TRAP transporter permease protein SiaT [Falsiruegeria litorea R37]